jgi:hypothetical protein
MASPSNKRINSVTCRAGDFERKISGCTIQGLQECERIEPKHYLRISVRTKRLPNLPIRHKVYVQQLATV